MDERKQSIFFTVILLGFAAVILLRCGAISPIPPNPYDPPDYCSAACDNMFVLNCPGWQGSPGPDERFGTEDDMQCVDVCRAIVQENTATLYQKCTAHAKTCDEVEACFETE